MGEEADKKITQPHSSVAPTIVPSVPQTGASFRIFLCESEYKKEYDFILITFFFSDHCDQVHVSEDTNEITEAQV